jgi:hypothetical protein
MGWNGKSLFSLHLFRGRIVFCFLPPGDRQTEFTLRGAGRIENREISSFQNDWLAEFFSRRNLRAEARASLPSTGSRNYV